MPSDNVPLVTYVPAVDYAHLPGEEHNPLMESTLHVDWSIVLLNAARHCLAGTGNLVTGNVPFAPDDGGPHTAPDVMVIPGAYGRNFGRYVPGRDGPIPSVCVEVLSPSNTNAEINRKSRRLLTLGVAEVYVLDPERETIVRMQSDGETLSATNAIGCHSPGLALSFAIVDDRLSLCCPAGRVVRPGDDPFGWLAEEMSRADRAVNEADAARTETAAARTETAAARTEAAVASDRIRLLEAELEALRAQRGHDQ